MTILPDVLAENLNIIFCGTAAGTMSAQLGAYYANPGNKFWRILYEIGLTPRLLSPHEFRTMPEYGLGLTDLAQQTFGSDTDLSKQDFDAAALREKILRYAPRVLAFTSKRGGQEFFGRKTISFGLQLELLGTSAISVLPSTSGLARRSWDAAHWHALAAFVLK